MILNKINRKVPSKLYHYTDLTSTVGIISENEFWLSNLFYLNDKYEYEVGLNLFKKYLKDKKSEYSENPKVTIFLNSLDSALDLLETGNVFIMSFSEQSDLLSQWRGYADNCKGTRIELSSLENIKTKGILLLPCIYSEQEQLDYVSHIVDNAIQIFNKTPELGITNRENFGDLEKPFSDAIQKAGSDFISKTNVACAIIKDKSFSEENEWRLLNFIDNKLFFRTKSHYVVPFIKMKISNINSHLTDIMTCSSPEPSITEKSIRFLLNNKGFSSTELSRSKIPYRL
jgi:hypothetical protein